MSQFFAPGGQMTKKSQILNERAGGGRVFPGHIS